MQCLAIFCDLCPVMCDKCLNVCLVWLYAVYSKVNKSMWKERNTERERWKLKQKFKFENITEGDIQQCMSNDMIDERT